MKFHNRNFFGLRRSYETSVSPRLAHTGLGPHRQHPHTPRLFNRPFNVELISRIGHFKYETVMPFGQVRRLFRNTC